MIQQAFVLFGKLQGQFERALFEGGAIGIAGSEHFLGLRHGGVQVGGRVLAGEGFHSVEQQGRQLVGFAAGYFDIALVRHSVPLSIHIDVSGLSLFHCL